MATKQKIGWIQSLRQKVGNILLTGGGAGTLQDKGSLNISDPRTMAPYFQNNFMARWQDYVRFYETSWEGRKAVTIPVDDALRIPVTLDGIDANIADALNQEYLRKGLDKALYKALIQERLLGGCVIMGIFREESGTDLGEQFDLSEIDRGDFISANVVDVTRISLPEISNDPFSPDFDKVYEYLVGGVPVSTSRMCVLEGSKTFNNASRQTLEGYRYNPAGFGESVLSPLYDLLIRVTGSQEAAYHLINMSSCLILSVSRLRQMEAAGSPVMEKMDKIIEQLSIYRGAVVDGEDVNFKQHAASFGSVPELMMSFLHILSAACDIPVTRFLGESPGGLNSTGVSDLENYYNNIAAMQQKRVKVVQQRLFDWCGANIFGGEEWASIGQDLELVYEPLWNVSATEQMQVDKGYMEGYNGLAVSGIIDNESVIAELKARGIFKTEVKMGEKPDEQVEERVEI
jgi:phage-related protein (TIGR01555 family)